jgi:hypothetical protein
VNRYLSPYFCLSPTVDRKEVKQNRYCKRTTHYDPTLLGAASGIPACGLLFCVQQNFFPTRTRPKISWRGLKDSTDEIRWLRITANPCVYSTAYNCDVRDRRVAARRSWGLWSDVFLGGGHEIALRMALGADRNRVVALVVREGVALSLADRGKLNIKERTGVGILSSYLSPVWLARVSRDTPASMAGMHRQNVISRGLRNPSPGADRLSARQRLIYLRGRPELRPSAWPVRR